jgi:hypothetical protein
MEEGEKGGKGVEKRKEEKRKGKEKIHPKKGRWDIKREINQKNTKELKYIKRMIWIVRWF